MWATGFGVLLIAHGLLTILIWAPRRTNGLRRDRHRC